jgi:DNA-binding GntR family transcriptional regulator
MICRKCAALCTTRSRNELSVRIEEAYRSSSRALMDLGGRASTSVVEHGAIIEAIEARNGELAEERMLHHIASVRQDLAALGKG